MHIQVAHIEAGLRSFDMAMPEEINRMVTDVISDFFFVTEESGAANLQREGKPEERIHLVGNVMIDNLLHQAKVLEQKSDAAFKSAALKASSNGYAFLTLHRPSNVDQRETFAEIADALNNIAEERDIIFPIHPRTRKMMESHSIEFTDRIKLMTPLGFQEALFLWKDAAVVLTDSGGLQEETTALRIPCVTIRENTERPFTIDMGTNILAGTSKEGILHAYRQALSRDSGSITGPPLWDGKAAERIWHVILFQDSI
jgi:UDP-N-acetylglucosamine 2-epimerase (non-hydrolysing)